MKLYDEQAPLQRELWNISWDSRRKQDVCEIDMYHDMTESDARQIWDKRSYWNHFEVVLKKIYLASNEDAFICLE